MRQLILSLILLILSSTPGSNCAHSFVHKSVVTVSTSSSSKSSPWLLLKDQSQQTPSSSRRSFTTSTTSASNTLFQLRGGGITSTSLSTTMSNIFQTLNSVVTTHSPLGVLSLWVVASTVVIPLTIYRQGYAFSVGYGTSIAAMAIYLMKQTFTTTSTTTLDPLLWASIFQGIRLATYLIVREFSSSEKKQQIQSFDKTPRLKRIPFATSVSLFYAFLMTPVMYVLRSESINTNNIILNTGSFLAWCGTILETIADYHKFYVKQRNNAKDDDSKDKFVGPTSGVYRITRHPNYTGEVLFYFGLFVSGIPFYGSNNGSIVNKIVGWVCSTLGFYGIYSIMTMATKRLDEKQKEKYSGQKLYDDWRTKVKPSIFPFINVD